MNFRSFGSVLAAAAAVLVTPVANAAPAVNQQPLAPNAWAQAASDLKPDPQVRFGRLSNGMTYALMRNATPTGEASMRLRIAAGSMMETDAQQGLAHFLEHMAFDGSTHVPAGEMAKILERRGLAFGADTNASTSWLETIYQLDLPRTDKDTVDTGLMLLREISSELKISQAAMDKERGVILSEERLRDDPSYRSYKSRLQFLLPDQKVSARMPIGQVEVIRNASRGAIEDFYEKYYRPERATLVVVGDFDVNAMEAKIKARFEGWTNTHPAGAEAALGVPAPRQSEAKLDVEPGAPMSIQVDWTSPASLAPETEARDHADALEDLALAVLNRRLGRLSRDASPPFLSASAYSGTVYDSAKVATLQVTAKPGGWRAALDAAEQEQRRLVTYGVLKSELDREIEDARTSLQERVAAASTRRTPQLANMLIGAIGERSVVQNPAQELEQFDQEVKSFTPEAVTAAARQAFAGSGPTLFVSAPTAIDGGQSAVLAAYQSARAKAVAAPTQIAEKTWPYAQFGAPGKVAERREVREFATTMVRFANGVRLTVKPTQFRKSQVAVQVRFGNGRLDLSKTTPSPVWAASAFIEGGLKQLTAEDIDQALTSKAIGAQFSMDDDAFILSGSAKSSDLATQMQLLTAYVTEPGFRPEAFERMRTYGLTLNSQLEATPNGVLHRDLSRLLHGGDLRWSMMPSGDVIASSSPADLKSLLTTQLDHGPIEVVIVGDVTVDRAIAETAATFGALHRKPGLGPASDSLKVDFPQASAQPIVEHHKGRADQAVAAVAWPTTDFYSNMREARALTVLSQIMQLRMLDDLRMDKGDTYSPSASADPSETYPGYGYFLANVEIPPAKIGVFFTEVQKIAEDLRTKPVSQDELTRATLPRIEQIRKARQSNEYWIGALTGAQTDPRRLEAVRTQISQTQAMTPADLMKAARKYLNPDKAWKFEVLPEDKVVAAK